MCRVVAVAPTPCGAGNRTWRQGPVASVCTLGGARLVWATHRCHPSGEKWPDSIDVWDMTALGVVDRQRWGRGVGFGLHTWQCCLKERTWLGWREDSELDLHMLK